MKPSCFLLLFLVSALLILPFSHGVAGRRMVDAFDQKHTATVPLEANSREMMQVKDYSDPGPNYNDQSGYPFSPPPPPQQ